jgi:hypothetical protein
MNPVRTKQIRTAVWTAVWLVVAIACLLLLSTIDNPDGTPWLESSLLGQTLTLLGVLSAIVLPALFAARKDAAVTRDQLENSHVDDASKVSNVRDDLDHKHSAVIDAVAALAEKMESKFDGVYAEFRGTRRDIGRAADLASDARAAADKARDKTDELVDRIDSVEAKVDGIVQATTGNIPVVEQLKEES